MAMSTLSNLPRKVYLELVPRFRKEKTQAFTTIILTLFGLMLFGFFAIKPTIETIVKLRKELVDSRFVNKSLEEKIANLSTLQQKYNALQQDFPVILRSLPKKPSVPLFIAQLQALARITNVTVAGIQTSVIEIVQAQPSGDYGSFTFSAETEGSPTAITEFLSTLINFERIVTVDTFSVTSADQQAQQKISIRGKAYFKH